MATTTEPTQKCPDCNETMTLDFFSKCVRRKSGVTLRCSPCNREYVSESKWKLAQTKTPAQLEEILAYRMNAKRDYNKANHEKLARGRRIGKMRLKVPGMVKELALLRHVVDACDNTMYLSKEWNTWATNTCDVAKIKHVVRNPMTKELDLAAERRYDNDPVIKLIHAIRYCYQNPKYMKYWKGHQRQIRIIVKELASFDGAEMHKALTYEPETHEPTFMTPPLVRWINKHYTPTAIAKRQKKSEDSGTEVVWFEPSVFEEDGSYQETRMGKDGKQYTKNYTPIYSQIEKPDTRERRLMEAQFGRELEPHYFLATEVDDPSPMDGLSRYLNFKESEVDDRRQAMDERNEKARKERAEARRAGKKQSAQSLHRKAKLAEYARKRRARAKSLKQSVAAVRANSVYTHES